MGNPFFKLDFFEVMKCTFNLGHSFRWQPTCKKDIECGSSSLCLLVLCLASKFLVVVAVVVGGCFAFVHGMFVLLALEPTSLEFS